MKYIFALLCCSFFLSTKAQVETEVTASPEETREILKSINLDSASFLREAADKACSCIDSLRLRKKSNEEISAGIAGCIEKQAATFEMMSKVLRSMKSDKAEDKKILINADEKEHNAYYFAIERRLTDSCAPLRRAIVVNNTESDNSFSKDSIAVRLYLEGTDAYEKEDFPTAVKFFRQALNRDPKFAFAWDNLGVSLRKMGNNAEAIKAYQKSLELDPKGVTPLQNIPVVFQKMKQYDKALEGYRQLIMMYPNNAEGYFGAGQVLIDGKKELESGLDYMCKAYKLYLEQGSPYRSDAESIISYLFAEFKKQGREPAFAKILKENNLNPSKD